jgi:hypothetical protein
MVTCVHIKILKVHMSAIHMDREPALTQNVLC